MMKLTGAIALLLAVTVPSALAQWDSNSENGQAIVHLFEWKWVDIAAECENFLGPKGYAGVQISPPNEYIVVYNDDYQRPWWERYQPVSYEIISRSGDLADFTDMVQRCNAVGVRIYVDLIANHMTGTYPSPGIGGTGFDYDAQDYPGVPYSSADFNDENCFSPVVRLQTTRMQMRNCKLYGLNDLNQSTDYVRQQIIEFMNSLIDIGVAGFRMDAVKHMWHDDLDVIYSSLNDLNSDFSEGSRPFIFQEVIDFGGEAVTAGEYTDLGRVTEFKYGSSLSYAFTGDTSLKYLSNFGEEWGFLDSGASLVFIDNHDNQRGHGSGGDFVLTFRDARLYKMATAFILAWPYGFTRVMSSYYWETNFVNGQDMNDWVGPPHDEDYDIISPEYDGDACVNDWVCEHRWREIANMVEFRNVVHGTDTDNWWDNGNNQIAFARGDRGFVAFNTDDYDMTETLQTGLAAGTYCDVISGGLVDGACTGKTVTVNADGTAYIELSTTEDEGVLAIHANAQV